LADKKKSKKKKKSVVYSGIGGQAVLEGIMMKNEDVYSVAVRLPNGSIDVKTWEFESSSHKYKIAKVPFIRGIFNFIDSMKLGMKTLSYSASFYEDEEPETKFDKFLEKTFGDKAENVVMGFTTCLSVILAIGIFMLLPMFVASWLETWILNDSLIAIIEGALRLAIFLLYVTAISLMKDIKRLYQYHGAEHKCINCIESGRSLNVKNVMKASRLHRRCGTSFLLIIMVITILLFFFIRVDTIWLRILLRLALVPVIAGISYEILRFTGTHDNALVRILSVPGMLLQKITTREPDEAIIEVAIASIEKIYDWREFQEKNFTKKTAKKTKQTEDGSFVDAGEETVEISVKDIEQEISGGDN